MHVAGIDVGAKELVVAISGERPGRPHSFINRHDGFVELLRYLRDHQVKRVVLEATGIYHLDLALYLHPAKDLELMVLNPKAAKHFAAACQTRTKTDRIDANSLAEFGQRMPFEPWQPPSDPVLALRACSRRLAALTHQRTRAKNQLHALRSTNSSPDFIIEDVQLSIAQFDRQIKTLQAKTVQLIEQDPHLQHHFALLLSVKGIGEKSAIQLLGELLALPADMRAKQWVAMAGLDPRQHQSGTSVDKKARISKAGNRHLRTALFMPALVVSQRVPQVRAYYEHLIHDRGLKKIQAVCAVMRKLLHAIHAMWKTDTRFDPHHFYRADHQTQL
jgi:transposase